MEPSKSSTRALTLDEAVSFAIILQKNEQLTEAHELFRRIIEAAPDHPRALHYAGVLAHQQGRNDEALALIERSLALAPDQADWCSNRGIVLQSDGTAGACDRLLPACDRPRSRPRQRPQQSGCVVAGDRTAGRSGSRVSRSHPPEPRTYRRLHQPRHSAQHLAAHRGSRGVLLQGDHAAAEISRSAQASGAGALHPGRVRQGRADLRAMAGRGAGRSDCAAHAGGMHGPGCARTRVERLRAGDLRQFRVQLRGEARDPVLSCAGARRGHAGGFGPRAGASPRRAGRGLRNRALRRGGRAVCAAVGRGGSLRRDAGACQGQERLPRADQSRAGGIRGSQPRTPST